MRLSAGGKALKIISYAFLIIGAVIILFPFYVTIITAMKTQQQSAESFFSFPTSFYLENFKSVFQKAGYFNYFKNSALITVVSVLFIFLLHPMAAYAISRNFYKKYFKLVYYVTLCGIFVPFQVVMIPLVKYLGDLHLNNQLGLIVMCVTMSWFPVHLFADELHPLRARGLGRGRLHRRLHHLWGVLARGGPADQAHDHDHPGAECPVGLERLPDALDYPQPGFQHLDAPPVPVQLQVSVYVRLQHGVCLYLIAMVPVMIAYICAQKYIVAGLTQGAVKS